MVLEKTLESPLDCKEIQLVHPKEGQSWVFTGRTDVEAETPIFWPPDAESWLIWKDPDVGKDWRWEEKGITEDEMVGWHHWLNGHEFEQVLGVGDGQGSLTGCSPWGHKESDNCVLSLWISGSMFSGGGCLILRCEILSYAIWESHPLVAKSAPLLWWQSTHLPIFCCAFFNSFIEI